MKYCDVGKVIEIEMLSIEFVATLGRVYHLI
jgi:hypothetical protein